MLPKAWIEIRSSLWFVPGLLVLAAVGLALGLVQLDIALIEELRGQSWQPLLNAGADGARGMLTAIAGSMITVAGVTFSITIVTMSLASTQYTPRILRNFMRDRANQAVLGVFVGIFTYCLLVLRTIRGNNGGPDTFVPLLAVFFAVLLALVSIGFLIFFVHHVAESIQASYILEAITKETLDSMEILFPRGIGNEEERTESIAAKLTEKSWHTITSKKFGYLQSLNHNGLQSFARKHDLILRLERSIGDFVQDGAPLVSVDRPLDGESAGTLRSFFALGNFRTTKEDAAFGIRQIVDIAIKALSPGVNDTSTAVSCLDHLSVILSLLAQRQMSPPLQEQEGQLHVIAPAPKFADYVGNGFDEIRLSAAGNVTILLQMLRAIQRVAAVTASAHRRTALLQNARLVSEMADHTVSAAYDRERINCELASVREALHANHALLPVLATEIVGQGKRLDANV